MCVLSTGTSAHAALTILPLRGLTIGEAADGSTTVGGARGRRRHRRAHAACSSTSMRCCAFYGRAGRWCSAPPTTRRPTCTRIYASREAAITSCPILSLLPRSRYHGHGVSSDPFSGGLVRIERHNSSRMAGYCPAETTPHLSAGSIALLKRFGHSGRVFNPAFALNIGPHAMPPRPDGPFVRYTLPAYELRRQLRDAIAAAESFELVYSSRRAPPATSSGVSTPADARSSSLWRAARVWLVRCSPQAAVTPRPPASPTTLHWRPSRLVTIGLGRSTPSSAVCRAGTRSRSFGKTRLRFTATVSVQRG